MQLDRQSLGVVNPRSACQFYPPSSLSKGGIWLKVPLAKGELWDSHRALASFQISSYLKSSNLSYELLA